MSVLLGPSADEKKLEQREKRWRTGARGEEMLAAYIVAECPGVALLNDRRIPASRANIDHIAITPTGIFVIDAKRYRGKIEVRTPLFGTPKLLIAGRDRTKLASGLEKQVAVVQHIVREIAAEVPVQGCFCFLPPEGFLADVGLPAFRTPSISGHKLFSAKRLAKSLNADGPFSSARVEQLQAELAEALPAA